MSGKEIDSIVVAQSREAIQKGSKSFSLAARIFGAEKRDAAFLLYRWCRHCDDEIDRDGVSPLALEKILGELKAQTLAAYRGEEPSNPVFVAFQHVVLKYRIPLHYPMELLEGMAMDVRRQRYPDFESLTLYCYRVAGTVGLMMSHIMGVSGSEALKHASDLGIGMQLTNIARDVLEDAERGRVYLPLDWVAEEGIDVTRITAAEFRAPLARVVKRMLTRSDNFYRSGDGGLRFLSWRCACAVSAARRIYSEIGVRVLRAGPRAWDRRVWIPLPSKLKVMLVGVGRVIAEIPARFLSPWRAAPLQVVWRHL
jgi:phytoene synthase